MLAAESFPNTQNLTYRAKSILFFAFADSPYLLRLFFQNLLRLQRCEIACFIFVTYYSK